MLAIYGSRTVDGICEANLIMAFQAETTPSKQHEGVIMVNHPERPRDVSCSVAFMPVECNVVTDSNHNNLV